MKHTQREWWLKLRGGEVFAIAYDKAGAENLAKESGEIVHVVEAPGEIADPAALRDQRDESVQEVQKLSLDYLELKKQWDDLLAALKGIEACAQERVNDVGADLQEGHEYTPHLQAELQQWTAVLSAIANAEGK